MSLLPFSLKMPGRSFRGSPPPLTPAERDLAEELRHDLEHLCRDIGDRSLPYRTAQLRQSAEWLTAQLKAAGCVVAGQSFAVEGERVENIIGEAPGQDPGLPPLLAGAHYDSLRGTVGANDNGSGVVCALALARRLAKANLARTLRFVFFVNEEPPYFQTPEMGSVVYAQHCRAQQEELLGFINLETIGHYTQEPKSQHYPLKAMEFVLPTTGNFLAFVANEMSKDLLYATIGEFREHATLPSVGAALPDDMEGIGFSDQWSFWQVGYPAIMLTDTAPFRYTHYHTTQDTPDKCDFESMARLTSAMEAAIRALCSK
ncbi:MAG: M28 family peptidase [Sumerlaeia bacterium]